MTEAAQGGTGTADQTPQRLIEAAEHLFADHGYAATSVRDLTSAAGCNVASINYHFGGKHRLYEAMFDRLLTELRDERAAAVGSVAGSAIETKDLEPILRAFAESFLRPLRDRERGMRLLRLFMNEMNDPHLPPGMFLERMVLPMERLMGGAMMAACDGLSEADAVASMHSVVGQLVHVANAWRVYEHAGWAEAPVYDLVRMIEHIVRFSVAGVEACRDRGANR